MSEANQSAGYTLPATQQPLVVVVGETASGKSALAIEIAKRHNGEIICADSRTIFKGMDIGTAKPSAEDRARVPHHMLDIVLPSEHFSAADFKQKALEIISEIRSRGAVPIMVGGTGLYVDAVVYDYNFRSAYNEKIRQSLQHKTLQELHQLIIDAGITTYSNSSNRRQLIRVLEAGTSENTDRDQIIDNVVIIGTKISRAELRNRITQRVEQMFRAGLRKEVDKLVETYGWEHEALTGIGYREFEGYYLREMSMSAVKRAIVQHTLQYAKRQRTWFKRNPHIVWFEDPAEAHLYIDDKLA